MLILRSKAILDIPAFRMLHPRTPDKCLIGIRKQPESSRSGFRRGHAQEWP